MKIGGKLQNKILILLAIVFMVFIMFKLLTISKSRDLAEQVLNASHYLYKRRVQLLHDGKRFTCRE
jgi:hypothetical protein